MKNRIVLKIQSEFGNCPDFIIKKIRITHYSTIYVLYLESVSSSSLINDFILKNITLLSSLGKKNFTYLDSIIPSSHTVVLNSSEEIEFYLTNGFTIIIKNSLILAFETKADLNRSVSEPSTEQGVFGPKDSFVENIQLNLGLVKRRIKSHFLKGKEILIGRKTMTMVQVLYLEDICEEELVASVINNLKKIDVDGILDALQIAEYLSLENHSPFPTVMKTERPDQVARALLQGKIAIMVDTSPFVLIVPAFFADFINPITDDYDKGVSVNFLKIVRLLCFFLTMMIPSIYIAFINYNPESIPTTLLLNFSMQRAQIPFPSIVEAILLLFVYEILRESDIRSPSPYGSAISILGALVLGEAAVSAGFVSPIMIIVVAITFITSLVFSEQELINAARYFRIIFLFSASIYGLYGILLAFIYFIIHILELTSLHKPYFYPLAPFDKNYLFKGLLRKKDITKDIYRSSMITQKNITRQRRKV